MVQNSRFVKPQVTGLDTLVWTLVWTVWTFWTNPLVRCLDMGVWTNPPLLDRGDVQTDSPLSGIFGGLQ